MMELEQILNEWTSKFNPDIKPTHIEIIAPFLEKGRPPQTQPEILAFLDNAYILTVLAGITPVKVVGEGGKLEEKYVKSKKDIYLLKPNFRIPKTSYEPYLGEVYDENIWKISVRINNREATYYQQVAVLSKEKVSLNNIGVSFTVDDIKSAKNPYRKKNCSQKTFTEEGDLDILRQYILGKKWIIDIDGKKKKINSIERLKLLSLANQRNGPNKELVQLLWRFNNRKHSLDRGLGYGEAVAKIFKEEKTFRYFRTEKIDPDACKSKTNWIKRQPIP